MSNIPCPSCRMWLSLPEQMLGQNVRCPGCGSIFVAEAPVEIPVLEDADPLAFTEDERPSDTIRIRNRIEPAVFWLKLSGRLFSLNVVLASIRSVEMTKHADPSFIVGFWVGVGILCLVTWFILRAAANLQALQGRDSIIGAAVVGLIFSAVQLLIGLSFLAQWSDLMGDHSLVPLMGLVLLGVGAVHIIAGVQTLTVVNHPEVIEAFRAKMGIDS